MSKELEQRQRLLEMVQKRHPEYHPIVSLADEANDDDNPVELRVNCHKTILRYIEPELKSVDISGELKNDSVLRIILDDGSGEQDGAVIDGEFEDDPALDNVTPFKKLPG